MKTDTYGMIIAWPIVIVLYAPLLALLVMMTCYKTQLNRLSRWVATSAFSDIFKMKKEKTCCPRGTQWLFKEIDLTAEESILSKVQTRFLFLFTSMLSLVLSLFWLLLVVDVSYDCEEDDLTKDCFEDKVSIKPQDPLNCSSAAVQDLIRNGAMQVVCYELVLNFGLAIGGSYGAFKLSLFAINVGTSALLMIKKTKTLRLVQVSGVILVFTTMLSLAIVRIVIPSVGRVFKSNVVALLQILTTAGTAAHFLCLFPWKEIIELNVQRENQ